MSPIHSAALLSVVVFLCSFASCAATTGWSGVVVDKTRAPLANVTVILRASTGATEYRTTTAASGAFAFSAIKPGSYRVSVVAPGRQYTATKLLAFREDHQFSGDTLRGPSRKVTAGWQVLNISTLMSGLPFTVYSGIQQTGAGAGGSDRPDLVAQPHLSTRGPVREDYFGRGPNNSSFFSIPIHVPGGTGPNQGVFGTLGRDAFRGPGFHQFDVALIKNTPFGRRGNGEWGVLQFRAEFFNIFNIVNFALPNNTMLGSGFGMISKTAGPSRQIQLSLRLAF